MSCNRQCFGPDGLDAVDIDCSECDGRDCGPRDTSITEQYQRKTGMKPLYENGYNYKQEFTDWLIHLYDIEHRRRVAAEALYELQTEYYLKINDYDNGQLSEMEYKISKAFKKWQSIIKEAGE
jgi:hypothetical protein